ncbi:MAG: aminopeptidase P family N-terminal domain-containing protein [Evtepia sp.]|uniref:aminopeptidase P family N-terminal domain-containing protein n=1 Tax=Evtepia sp. TaxID=2773933 RepID=UPI002A74BDD8|nr:aminopeptidase P family N-terminal domain-containing protein [Evtepia sp.]MDY3013674.1 aminopeptidase P family N-terminal domain-containing protein [Evtepia sp.]
MRKQLQALRDAMARHTIDACLIPTADFHGSEYVGRHFACREYISGFTGSAGTLLVFPQWAGLWTDGRYFLQAEEQLEGTGIRLMQMGQPGVPTLESFLRSSLQADQTFAFDGRCVDARTARRYHTIAKQVGARINLALDLPGEIWMGRPPRSAQPVWALSTQLAGESRQDKLARVREAMAAEGADQLLLTSLEDIAWLLNLRGDDVACTPVFLAYLALTQESCHLFAQPSAFSPALLDQLDEDGIFLRPYEEIYRYANQLHPQQTVMLDTRRVNATLLTSIPTKVKVIDRPNPTEAMKAIKNPTEQANFRKAHLADGIALTRFMYWLKTNAGKAPITERSAAHVLEDFRRQDETYLQPSFDPILAAGPHSAVVHYSATEESDAPIQAEGFLLADTGGHYTTGTTDCTRTYALGPLNSQQKACYTAVLRGNLNLAAALFKEGCTGSNLDYLARQPLWAMGLDFNHGTGHGVGYLLSVHEGPQRIHWHAASTREAPLAPGMVTSDEPGVYFDGAYGIRLENLLLCVEEEPSPFGSFLSFETLTLTPFDLDAVEPTLMSPQERALLNTYHARVYEAIAPHLPPEEAAWLREATRPLP